jgi:hypothetical protein
MTERAGSVANNTAPGTLAVSVSRTRDGGLIIAVRYSYEGRPPSSKKRIEMAKAMLGKAVDRLQDGNSVDIAFSEDSSRRIRTDRMEV